MRLLGALIGYVYWILLWVEAYLFKCELSCYKKLILLFSLVDGRKTKLSAIKFVSAFRIGDPSNARLHTLLPIC